MTDNEKSPINRLDIPFEEFTAVKKYLTGKDDVAFAYLFGSRARGTAGPLSDVDIFERKWNRGFRRFPVRFCGKGSFVVL